VTDDPSVPPFSLPEPGAPGDELTASGESDAPPETSAPAPFEPPFPSVPPPAAPQSAEPFAARDLPPGPAPVASSASPDVSRPALAPPDPNAAAASGAEVPSVVRELRPASAAPAGRGRREERPSARGPRPDLSLSGEALYRESAGYRLRLEPPDLARLRELPGSKGKTDQELGEIFFDGQAARLSASLAEDVPAPAEVRVVVDPYSRQAFLAVERKIRSILSF
jgi:hypothetical protein